MRTLTMLDPLKAGIVALCLIFNFSALNLLAQCNCDYTLYTSSSGVVNFNANNVQPGETICLKDTFNSFSPGFNIDSINGSTQLPVNIISCGFINIDTLNLFGNYLNFDGLNTTQINKFCSSIYDSMPSNGISLLNSKHQISNCAINEGFSIISDSMDLHDCDIDSSTFYNPVFLWGDLAPMESSVILSNYSNIHDNNISNSVIEPGIPNPYYVNYPILHLYNNNLSNAAYLTAHVDFDSIIIYNNNFYFNEFITQLYWFTNTNSIVALYFSALNLYVDNNKFINDELNPVPSNIYFYNRFGHNDQYHTTSNANRHFTNNLFFNFPIDIYLNPSPNPMLCEFTHNTVVSIDYTNPLEIVVSSYNNPSSDDTIKIVNNIFYNALQGGNGKYRPYFTVRSAFWWLYEYNYYKYCQFEEKGNVYLNSLSEFATNDYQLSANSPALNAGVQHSSVPQEDYFGNPRVLGNRPDAGYNEWKPDAGFLSNDQFDLQGVYCKTFIKIVRDSFLLVNGDTVLNENLARDYLTQLQSLGFNYLILYGLNSIHWSPYNFGKGQNSAADQMVEDFIRLAKSEYGIVQVAATGEKASSFNKIATYNLGKDYLSRIDVLHYEYEFWNVNKWGSYQMDYNPGDMYLNLQHNIMEQDIPGSGFPPMTDSEEHVKHFSYMYKEVQKAKDIAINNDLVLEYYASRTEIDAYDMHILPNNPSFPNEELLLLANYVDRFCLAHYTPTDPNSGDGLFIKPTTFGNSSNYEYYGTPYGGADRYEKLGSNGTGAVVMPIFHGHSDYSGGYLDSLGYRLNDAFESFKDGTTPTGSTACGFYNLSYCATNYSNVSNNTLAGSIWYKDTFLLEQFNCIYPYIVLNSEESVTVRDSMATNIDFSIIGTLPVDISISQNGTLINTINNWSQSDFQIYISNFNASDQGTYTVKITASTNNSCNQNDSSIVEFYRGYSSQKKGSTDFNDQSTSEDEAVEDNQSNEVQLASVVVYPNPTIGEIHIQNNQLLFDVTIVDQAGRVLYSAENCPQQIDLKGFTSAGLYYFIAKTENGIYRKSIVVQ